MRRNRERAERHAIEDLSDAELVRRLRTMDRENRQQAPGKQHRWGKSQRRNARFVELLKALYEDRCQVCGQLGTTVSTGPTATASTGPTSVRS
jgi:hypothetical protein